MKNITKNQKGFTILELIIASTVFSLIMLLSTTGLIQIGKTYHKGQITAKTQETTRGVAEEISREVQFSGKSVQSSHLATDPGADYGGLGANGVKIKATCIGDTRYTYVANTTPNRSRIKVGQTDDYNNSSPTLRHLLWVDKKPTTQPCTVAVLGTVIDFTQGRELLANNMRLTDFIVEPSGDNVKIKIKAYYGDFDLAGSDGTGFCESGKNGGQFCASSELSTVVRKRI